MTIRDLHSYYGVIIRHLEDDSLPHDTGLMHAAGDFKYLTTGTNRAADKMIEQNVRTIQ
jgi:hypothetical protein